MVVLVTLLINFIIFVFNLNIPHFIPCAKKKGNNAKRYLAESRIQPSLGNVKPTKQYKNDTQNIYVPLKFTDSQYFPAISSAKGVIGYYQKQSADNIINIWSMHGQQWIRH